MTKDNTEDKVSYAGNGTAGIQNTTAPTGFFFQMPKQEPVACVIDGDLYFHHEIDWEDLAYQGHGVELLYAAPSAAPVQEPDRVRECAQRLVEHADFRLGGVLSAASKAKDIPSKAVSQVKARHLASLRDALVATPPAAQRPFVGLTDESVVSAAARVLSDRVAASCNVDCGDMWMLHGNDSIEDARAMLEAAEAKLKEKNT